MSKYNHEEEDFYKAIGIDREKFIEKCRQYMEKCDEYEEETEEYRMSVALEFLEDIKFTKKEAMALAVNLHVTLSQVEDRLGDEEGEEGEEGEESEEENFDFS
jgi:hypothetical protein